MRRHPRILAICGLAVIALTLAGVAYSATTVNLQFIDRTGQVKNAQITLFLSYGTEQGQTNDKGQVTIPIDGGRGFWIEVDGKRLNQFYKVDQVPNIIDVSQVGYMTWHGRG